jgi:hypothetical protein
MRPITVRSPEAAGGGFNAALLRQRDLVDDRRRRAPDQPDDDIISLRRSPTPPDRDDLICEELPDLPEKRLTFPRNAPVAGERSTGGYSLCGRVTSDQLAPATFKRLYFSNNGSMTDRGSSRSYSPGGEHSRSNRSSENMDVFDDEFPYDFESGRLVRMMSGRRARKGGASSSSDPLESVFTTDRAESENTNGSASDTASRSLVIDVGHKGHANASTSSSPLTPCLPNSPQTGAFIRRKARPKQVGE